MKIYRVIISYPIKSARRAQVRSLFGENVRICFLDDFTGEEREQEIAEADVLLTWNPAKELKTREFSLFKRLRLVQLLSAGADHVPFRDLPREAVIASNVGAYSRPIAEHVLAMALALAKNLFREHLKLSQGEFDQKLNRMLHGSICGILGFGGIGKATAHLMSSIGMRIDAINRSGKTSEHVEFIGTLRDLPELLSVSDVLVISLPLTKATRGLIGKRELEMMKPDAILINVARGGIVDERALYERLVSHPDFKAGIDAWWSEPFGQGRFRTNYPFFMLPNVLGSPHNSALAPGVNAEGTRLAIENVKRFLAGQPITGEVRREDYI